MFGDLPDRGSPGFRVGRPEDPPGFRVSDGGLHPANSGTPGFFAGVGPFLADLQDVAEKVGARANAVMNGAYSVFPGAYSAARAVARGVGVLGPDEFRRFGQEADLIGAAAGQVASHPRLAACAARDAVSILADNPLLPYYLAGRGFMGYFSGLGLGAMAGDALRAVENGHDLIDAVIQHGAAGIPSVDR